MSEEPPERTTKIVLRRIIRDPSLQVRTGINEANVRRLQDAYRSGREVDPVRVADVGGRPFLVDGWHRVEALERLGEALADAVVVKAGEAEARWLAAEANMNHGLPLKRKELRKVFRAFEDSEDPSSSAGRPSPDKAADRAEDEGPKSDSLDLDGGEGAAVGKAHEALGKAVEALGADAVDSLQHDVVAYGELPEALPEGVTADQVQTVVDGYTAQANSVLRDTGASVTTLEEMLDGNELGAARMAAFRGDDAELKALGREAVARLARLPNRNPALFQELTAALPEGVTVAKDGNAWWLNLPGDQRMPWSEAVKAGVVKF